MIKSKGVLNGSPQFMPWQEDPDPADHWEQRDYAEMRARLRAYWNGEDYDDAVKPLFEEEEHPRGLGGRWVAKGGTSSKLLKKILKVGLQADPIGGDNVLVTPRRGGDERVLISHRQTALYRKGNAERGELPWVQMRRVSAMEAERWLELNGPDRAATVLAGMSETEIERHRWLEENWNTLNPEQREEYHGLTKKFDERWTQKLVEKTKEDEIERRVGLIKQANKVCKDLDFPITRVDFVDGTREFEVNGVKMTAGGDADIAKGNEGRIRMYLEHLSDTNVAGVMAHEIEHFKFQHARDTFNAEYDAMIKEPGPAPDPNAESFPQRRGGHFAVMNAMGELRPPYDKKYPIYTLLQKQFEDIDELARGDGVSAYSASYWKAWHNYDETGGVTTDIAMHETLAEMARYKYLTGKFPEHYGYSPVINERNESRPTPEGEDFVPNQGNKAAGTLRWRTLYRAVDKLWKERSK